jgi:hypothetical protein
MGSYCVLKKLMDVLEFADQLKLLPQYLVVDIDIKHNNCFS